MKLIIKILISATLPWIWINCYSQEFYTKNYTVNDGLPSSEILDMLQDGEGYLWFATGYGICRYDGYEFKTFTTKDGLAENSNVIAFLDYLGRPWFSGYSGRISYYENGTVKTIQINDTIEKISQNHFLENIYIDSLSNIWFKPNISFDNFIITNHQKIKRVIGFNKEDISYSMFIKNFPNGIIWGFNEHDSIVYDIQNNHQIELQVIDNTYYLNVPIIREHHKICYHKISDIEFVFSVDNQFIWFKNNEILFKKKFGRTGKRIIALYVDKENNIWVSVDTYGIYFFSKGDMNNPQLLFKDKTVTRILQDAENNYWFSTLKNGVFMATSTHISIFDESNGFGNFKIMALEARQNEIYFSTKDYRIFILNLKENTINQFKPPGKITGLNYIRDILLQHRNSTLWFIGSDSYRLSPDNQISAITELKDIKQYMAIEKNNGNVLIATDKGSFEYHNVTLFQEHIMSPYNNHILMVYEDNEGAIYYGSLDGLYKYYDEKIYYLGDKYPLFRTRISEIKATDQLLLFGTRGEGLILKRDSILLQVTTNEGLCSNMINCIYPLNDTNIWIGTNSGLNNLIIHDFFEMKYDILKYTMWDGLPSNEVKDIIYYQDRLWLGTNNGLASFDPETIKNPNIPPRLHLNKITVNDIDTTLIDLSNLKYNQNNITFYFKGINFRFPGDVSYKYRLKGLNDNWIKTKNISARFFSLPPGTYTFEVISGNTGSVWNKNPLTVHFAIMKHFTQTTLFLIGAILLVALIIAGIVLIILRNQKKRAIIKRNILLSELKALRSQMNPHFIFNSMNSIQHFILEQETESANLYLANFSSLMRKILENSKHNYIKLSEELESIELYLDLEKLRFENKFDFEIKFDEDIDPDLISIPPMLIQPYLENAILHGLMSKKERGLLLLSLNLLEKKTILCTIKDNGIGREKANKISVLRKKHRSTGMKNIDERLEILNKINKSNMRVKIIDLYNRKEEAAGTEVKLYIQYL
ncbi:MAG: histidine kinase [Bacteroidales bacterium]|nr:histidine kinase [Bacteroidales bacterium]